MAKNIDNINIYIYVCKRAREQTHTHTLNSPQFDFAIEFRVWSIDGSISVNLSKFAGCYNHCCWFGDCFWPNHLAVAITIENSDISFESVDPCPYESCVHVLCVKYHRLVKYVLRGKYLIKSN